MIYKNSGASALLLVFAISFILTLSVMRCWYVGSLICDIQEQRELYYKHFYITEKILDFGIKLCCERFDDFLKFKISINCDLNSCLSGEEVKTGFKLEFFVSKVLKKDILLLTVNLINKNEVKCNLRCLLERNVRIKKNSDKKDNCFVVNNFTLSTSL